MPRSAKEGQSIRDQDSTDRREHHPASPRLQHDRGVVTGPSKRAGYEDEGRLGGVGCEGRQVESCVPRGAVITVERMGLGL